MKIPVVSVGSTMSFGKIVEPHKNSYSTRQYKLSKRIKEIANKPCPDDQKGRSYVDYFEQKYDGDLYILSDKETNTVNLYAKNSDGNMDIVKHYRKGRKPREIELTRQVEFFKDEARDFYDKLITYGMIAFLILGVLIIGNKNNLTQKTKEIVKQESVQKLPERVNTFGFPYFKRLAK